MFRRVGGKSRLIGTILPLIPAHEVYVEPFIGGGSIFFAKEPSSVEVINDLDEDVARIYADMRDVGASIKRRTFKPSRKKFNRLMGQKSFSSKSDRLYRNLYITRFSYAGNRSTYIGEKEEERFDPNADHGKKWKDDKWQTRLKDVKIHNEDYRKVIDEYDSKDTFFYLDPPYSQSDPAWGYSDLVNPEDMLEQVNKIKGKFLLSYDDTPEIRKLFKGYRIKSVRTDYGYTGVTSDVKEVLIMNY
jgi:DNA adenine methylase